MKVTFTVHPHADQFSRDAFQPLIGRVLPVQLGDMRGGISGRVTSVETVDDGQAVRLTVDLGDFKLHGLADYKVDPAPEPDPED
jgi:hypothetical protein